MTAMAPIHVNRTELATVEAPAGTDTWAPIKHALLADEVRNQLTMRGFSTSEESHGLSHEGKRYFGTMTIEPPQELEKDDFNFIVGIRNSNDQRFPAGICCGSQVLVCSNLCFSGDITLARKHTSHIMRDLPGLVNNALDGLEQMRGRQNARFDTYRNQRWGDRSMSMLVIRAMEEGVISSSQISKVWDQWREPKHEEFQPRTMFSALNSFTEVFKSMNIMSVPQRGAKLHSLCDSACSLAA